MGKKETGVFFWIALILVSYLAAFAARQNQTQKVVRHDAAAVIKLVPVRVLDADGKPVRGLRKEDFILYDNKVVQKITEFEVHESSVSPNLEQAAEAAGRQVLAELNRKYFFVLDMQGSDRFGNRDAKKAVLEFVESQLKPGDEASVLTFGAFTGLILKQYLTSDLDKIEKAIQRSIEMGGGASGSAGLGVISGGGLEGGSEAGQEAEAVGGRGGAGRAMKGGEPEGQIGGGRALGMKGRETDDTPFGSGTGILLDTAGGGWLARAARTKADFDTSMAELAKAMKYVSGSKSVVYFSTRTPGKEVATLFAEANATIYSVNTNSVPPKGGGLGASQKRAMKERQGDALKSFAAASGGHYFADVKDASTIAADIEILSGNYYVLGYYIKPSWDGRSHEIKVEVRQPDLKVLAQKGFNNPKPYAQLSDLEKKLQLFDLALSDKPAATEALGLPLQVLFGSAMKDVNAAVLMGLEVDERAGLPPEKAEIYTFIFDSDSKIVLAERGEMDLTPHARKTLFPYLLTSLQPGDYECRAVARGIETGQAATARLSFSLPEPAATSGVALFSPLLLVPGIKPEFVRMARLNKKEKETASIIRFYPFLPDNCSPLLQELPPGAKKILALLPFVLRGEQTSESGFDTRLIDEADGEEISVNWGIIDSKTTPSGMDYLLIGIGLPDLGTGIYCLEFSVTDEKSGAKTSVTSQFVKK